MKRFVKILFCVLITVIALSGCAEYDEIFGTASGTEIGTSAAEESTSESPAPAETKLTETSSSDSVTEPLDTAAQTLMTESSETAVQDTEPEPAQTTSAAVLTETAPPQTTALQAEDTDISEGTLDPDGAYIKPEDVADYIHTFGTLPKNFITKSEAKALGWDSSKGNLWEVAEGKSIGGDRFGNYEGLLPNADGRKYTKCDVNYSGGYRGKERIIFSNDGLIFYTDDHYKTFTQLY